MSSGELCLFALSESRALGQKIAHALQMGLARHEERFFEDGEHKTRALCSVRGRDVYVIQSLYGEPGASVNDKLTRLLFFIGALKDASAACVTAVVPYLCYARKDRKSKPRDPVLTRYVACLMEAVQLDRIVTLDVHNVAAFQNAFRCRADHLEACRLFVDHFAPLVGDAPVTVVSPDVGGIKRAEALRIALEHRLARDVGNAFLEKNRSEGRVTGDAVVGEIQGRIAIIIDDLIATGGTIWRAAAACRKRGARNVYACATHGLFAGDAEALFAAGAPEQIVVTNSVPAFRLTPGAHGMLTVLDTAPLFAEAVHRIHSGGSVVDLLET